jgi:hypothetical protein
MGGAPGRTVTMRALLTRAALLAASLLVIPAHAEKLKRPVSGFKRVELRLPLDVTIRPGKEFTLELDLRDPEVADKIATEVKGDTLVISSNAHSLSMHGKNVATITMPELRGASIGGSGNVDISGFDQSGELGLSISGSGDIAYSGKSSGLSVSISGSGSVKAAGAAGNLAVSIDGSGDFKGGDFAAKNASVAVNGSGNVDLRITGGAVQFAVNGSGDIRWWGDASTVSAVTHGSGSIQKKR